MKKLILNNWQVKLICLAIAATLWYLIRENVGRQFESAPGGAVPWSQKSPNH